MMTIDQLKAFYSPALREMPQAGKYMLKEYVQLLILDWLSTSPYSTKICFIGGTCLRLVKGINRFSEDLDFDCKGLAENEFMEMTDGIVRHLGRSGFEVETRDRVNDRLKAFRRNIYFPGLLFSLGLSLHRDERFLVKVEAQDQGVNYRPLIANISRLGFFFPLPVPPDSILCAMKLSALLHRGKGRDFFDAMFLLQQSEPDYGFLAAKTEVRDREQLKSALLSVCETTDLVAKARDVRHLLLSSTDALRVERFKSFVENM